MRRLALMANGMPAEASLQKRDNIIGDDIIGRYALRVLLARRRHTLVVVGYDRAGH